ncbi:MAG TPA: MFS transporter [Verrucomicrobiae bacterium]|jgi:OPA family glycerol-3-phosphate transporter-like MFS transporter
MNPDLFYPITIALCLIAVVVVYFLNNPLKHSRWFITRRFINWFPLGMTYAFLCMGRYNIIVAKGALGTLMSNEDIGIIFGVGNLVYGLSFLVNGPLIDKKLGGKAGMLISAVGAALSNAALGVLTWFIVAKHSKVNLVLSYSLIYSVNMYFQSFGAMSIIKVKAYWFHVRERGVFGAIFGSLISIGVYFAFDWGSSIIDLTKANATGWLHDLFVPATQPVDATWSIFYIPAAILVVWIILDIWLIKDTPEEAGFPYFDTHDASSGMMHVDFSVRELLVKVCASPLMRLIACVEFSGGIFRYCMTQWYPIFSKAVPQTGAEYIPHNWGWYTCIFGIVGGFSGGLISDRLFQSRRGPPTAMLCALALLMAILMVVFMYRQPLIVGWAAVFVVAAAIGITSLMSGTAATDFGGRKATATSMGIINAFAYFGNSMQSFILGFLLAGSPVHWARFPLFVIPFAIAGLFISFKIWNELPHATRKYIAENEQKRA